MRLKWKIGISIFAAIVFATIVNIGVIAGFFLPSFEALDEHAATVNGARAFEYLQAEAESLSSLTRGWARWDETYSFAGDLNRAYREANLSPQNLQFMNVAGFAITDDNGVVTYSAAQRPEIAALLQVGRSLPTTMFDRKASNGSGPSSEDGYIQTSLGPLLVSIAPIRNPAHGNTGRGYLLFARLVGQRIQTRLHDQADLDFALKPYDPADLAPSDASRPGTAQAVTKTGDTLTARILLPDVAGRPSYVLSVVTPQEFANVGWLGVKGAMVRFVGFTVIFLGTVAWMIGRLVAKPLAQMANRMSQIAETGELDQTLDIRRSDEIGWVADVFNRMVGELRAARSRLIEQSYSTGMADLAAGILNNVRSAVDPVVNANRAAIQLAEKIDTSTLQDVGRELTYAQMDQDRRRKLGAYVNAFTEGTRQRLNELKAEIERIGRGTRHIENILEDHESISRWPPQSVPVDCHQLVKEVVQGISGMAEIPIDVEVSNNDGRLPAVLGHSFILRQVLGNLLANSVDAVRRAQRKRGRIHVLTRKTDLAGMPVVEIVVGDNGAGFTAVQAEGLFTRGYSTRSDRPGGFGLYWCREALSAMNATITAQSPGPGLGATFRIFLPVAQADATAPIEESDLKGAA